jgi:hypothetical protein
MMQTMTTEIKLHGNAEATVFSEFSTVLCLPICPEDNEQITDRFEYFMKTSPNYGFSKRR